MQNANNIFGTTSNNITKCYKGFALCPLSLRALFDKNIAEDGKIHCVYKLIDKTNGFEYYGKINTGAYSKFRKYVGSGTLLRHFIKLHGVHNFEQHLIAFYNTSAETEVAERNIVDADYLENSNTYNMAIGGKDHFSNHKKAFHSADTMRTFKCNEAALNRILKTFPEMRRGQSPLDTENSHWMNGTMQQIAKKNKTVKLNRLNVEGQYEEKTIPLSDLIHNLNIGWTIASTKLWMHIPNQTIYQRGKNWKQVTSDTKNVMHYIQSGFVPGRPPRFEGAVIDRTYRTRNSKKTLNKSMEANIL